MDITSRRTGGRDKPRLIRMETDAFFERLRKNPRPVIMDLWAPWCGPCQAVKPALEKLGREYSGRVDLWEVNADEHPALLRRLRVYGIPTLIAYRGNQELLRYVGVKPASALKSLFETLSSGGLPAPAGLTSLDRFLRLGTGLAIIAIGLVIHSNWLLLLLGGLISFSAIHDRCPIWRAVTSRFHDLVHRVQKED
jgi:thioredoxin